MAELEKRKWCYAQHPAIYEIANCPCGSDNVTWSEFKKHLWCFDCETDFLPEHNGIFDGPIPVQACNLMGIYFDRINLETNEIETFDSERNLYTTQDGSVSVLD